eukprot:GFYU01010586.1.p1 GENE.GFYU01010586.1~~GFYU01010586.1.p1  ORF type:complete len:238 (-),score=14.11 GFYU01010586.1:62-703(-)
MARGELQSIAVRDDIFADLWQWAADLPVLPVEPARPDIMNEAPDTTGPVEGSSTSNPTASSNVDVSLGGIGCSPIRTSKEITNPFWVAAMPGVDRFLQLRSWSHAIKRLPPWNHSSKDGTQDAAKKQRKRDQTLKDSVRTRWEFELRMKTRVFCGSEEDDKQKWLATRAAGKRNHPDITAVNRLRLLQQCDVLHSTSDPEPDITVASLLHLMQ